MRFLNIKSTKFNQRELKKQFRAVWMNWIYFGVRSLPCPDHLRRNGLLERHDTRPKSCDGLDDFRRTVTDLLNTATPSRTILELTRSNGLLR